MMSLSKQNKTISATRGAQQALSGMSTIGSYHFEPNLIIICPKDNGGCHKLSNITTNYISPDVQK